MGLLIYIFCKILIQNFDLWSKARRKDRGTRMACGPSAWYCMIMWHGGCTFWLLLPLCLFYFEDICMLCLHTMNTCALCLFLPVSHMFCAILWRCVSCAFPKDVCSVPFTLKTYCMLCVFYDQDVILYVFYLQACGCVQGGHPRSLS